MLDGAEFLLKIDVERGSSHFFLVSSDCGVVGVDDDSDGHKVGCLPALLQDNGNSLTLVDGRKKDGRKGAIEMCWSESPEAGRTFRVRR